MKNLLHGPKQLLGFFNNYKAPGIAMALLVLSVTSYGQYDSLKTRQQVQAYGFDWKNGKFRYSFVLPSDSTTLAVADSGAVAVISGVLYVWNGYAWVASSGSGSTNTSLGSGYKIAVNGTNDIKSLGQGWGVILDSATSGQVGVKVDTAAGKVATKSDLSGYWKLTGNAGIDTSTDFIGTTDNVDFPIKTNDVRRFTVNTSGAWGIGATPDYGTSGYLFQSAGSAAAPAWVDHATLTTPLSNLTAAAATNSINNANYGQTWAWNTLTGTAMTLSTTTTASTPASILLSLVRSGANATAGRTTYALSVANGHSGTNATNYGLNSLVNTGATTYGGSFTSAGTSFAYGVNSSAQGTGANVAGTFSATGGTSNYAIIVPSSGGSVGIGTSAPDSTLHVVGGFKYANGSQGAGKYLTSDANGGATWATISTGLTVGTTTITSGTNTKVLYNNSGVLGEYTVSGTGNVAMTTSPAFTTPDLGTPSALVGTNITGTGTGFTAGAVNNSLSIGAELIAGGATTYNGSAAKTLGIQPTSVTNAMLAGSIAASKLVGTDITTVGTITTGTWNAQTIPDQNPSLMALLGSTILAEPVTGDVFKTASSTNLTDGQVRYVAIYIPRSMTITGVKFMQQTQGSYTADNYNGVGLYSYSGGNLTLVASSTDDGNIWKATSFTWSSKAFSSTYAASPGLYFVALLYNSSAQTTAPALRANQLSSDLLNTIDFTNSAKLGASLTGQTALPAGPTAMSTLATNSSIPYLALY